jgi:hypothetical protein
MAENLSLVTYRDGDCLDDSIVQRIRRLFQSNYYNYHYLDTLYLLNNPGHAAREVIVR